MSALFALQPDFDANHGEVGVGALIRHTLLFRIELLAAFVEPANPRVRVTSRNGLFHTLRGRAVGFEERMNQLGRIC